MKRFSIRPSLCPSVCLSRHSTAAVACGAFLQLSAMRAREIDQQRRPPGAQQQMRAVSC